MKRAQADWCYNPGSHMPSNIYTHRHVRVMAASQNAPVTVSTMTRQGIFR